MKKLLILKIFYTKLIIPTLLFSLLIAFITGFSLKNFGISFMLILPTIHYFIYEIRLKNEYYFYANFGFSKHVLWLLTVSTGVFIKCITALL